MWYKCLVWLVVLYKRESAFCCLSFPLFVHFSFSPSKVPVTNSLAFMRPSLQIFYTYWEWSSILWDRKQNWDLCCLLSPFFHFSLPIKYVGKFVTNISQELGVLHIGFCNLVQVLWIICCFMWKRTRFLLHILPLISSLFFLSNFQISKTFISFLRDWVAHKIETWSTDGQ